MCKLITSILVTSGLGGTGHDLACPDSLCFILIMKNTGALLIYGRGGKLGDFKQFGDDLVARELKRKYGSRISAFRAERRHAFFDAISKAPWQIAELHVFSHSIGASLMLGFGDFSLQSGRENIVKKYSPFPVPQREVLDTEKGAVFVHDFVRGPYQGLQNTLRKRFASNAFIKIWGCNAAVKGHVFTDVLTRNAAMQATAYTASPDVAVGEIYYWRALNGPTDSPSIAVTLSRYFNVPVYAAGSGAHIEVDLKGRWVKPSVFKSATGHGPYEPDDIRLHPDRGEYDRYAPNGL